MPHSKKKRKLGDDSEQSGDQTDGLAPEQPLSAFAAAKALQQQQDGVEGNSSAEGEDTDYHDPLYHEEPQSSEYEAVETDEEAGSLRKPQRASLKQKVYANRTQYQPVTLSTWQPNQDNIKDRKPGYVTISIRSGETLLLTGSYDLEVQHGAVSLYGAALGLKARHKVYAPSTHAIPVITGLAMGAAGPSVIRITSCRDYLCRLRPASPLFGRITNEQYEASELVSHIKQPSFSYVQHSASDALKRFLQPLTVPSPWTQAFDRISKTARSGVPRVLVCGPKNSGKSTFARVLLNHLLTARPPSQIDKPSPTQATPTVAYLDLDPGQPEFSPPCQISLTQVRSPILGPPYTHNVSTPSSSFRVLRSHSITATSPKEDIAHYLACAKDLLNHYAILLRAFPLCPLIVNTPGWIQGEGLDILTSSINSSDVSAVACLGFENIAEELVAKSITEALERAAQGRLFLNLESEASPILNRTSADLRAMQYLSFFHSKSSGHEQRWTSSPVQQQAPISLSYASDNSDVLAFAHLNEGGPADDLWPVVLDEALVAIVLAEDDTFVEQISARVRATELHGLPVLRDKRRSKLLPVDPAKSRLVSLAYVKKLDLEEKMIELVTPHAAQVHALSSDEDMSSTSAQQAAVELEADEDHDEREATLARRPRLVILQGFFDAPSWASMSAIHHRRHVQRAKLQEAAATNPDVRAEMELHKWLGQQMAGLAVERNENGMEDVSKPSKRSDEDAWQELKSARVRYLEPVRRRKDP